MKKILALALIFGLGISFLPNSSHAEPMKIVAVVNEDVISSQDIKNRINLFLMTTQIPLNEQTRNMIFERVLNNTIDEKVKLQSAQKEGIEITPKELEASVRQFETNNKIGKGQLKEILKQNNVSMETFEEQMKADLAWGRLLRRKLYADTHITQGEVEKALAEAKEDLATPKFFVSEIFIKKDQAKDLSVLVGNLRQDPRFELYAMQFSQSPTASNGGRLGWVNKGKLPEAIERKLSKMKEGEVSDPILAGDGYYIVKLDKTFNPKVDKPQIPTTEDMRKFLENKKLDEFGKKYLQDQRQKAVIEYRG